MTSPFRSLSNNELGLDLPLFPNKLQTLILNDNLFSQLPQQWPSNLKHLNIQQNNFLQITLPLFPSSLTHW